MKIKCERCDRPLKISGQRNEEAKMLRRSGEPKGLCVNCAVHDWLRNTYPVNLILANSGVKALRFDHVRQQFAQIMRVGKADADSDEIDWEAIIDNWDLPFKNKVKATATNPASQEVLDRELAGRAERDERVKKGFKRQTVCGDHLTITSFEQLNELEPGLGDNLKRCLRGK